MKNDQRLILQSAGISAFKTFAHFERFQAYPLAAFYPLVIFMLVRTFPFVF